MNDFSVYFFQLKFVRSINSGLKPLLIASSCVAQRSRQAWLVIEADCIERTATGEIVLGRSCQ